MSSASGSPKRIPDDFDPFAMPSSAPRNTDDPLRDLAAASVDLNAIDAHAKRNSLLEFDLEPKANPSDPLHGGTPSLVDSQQVVDPLRLVRRCRRRTVARKRLPRRSCPACQCVTTFPKSARISRRHEVCPRRPAQPPLARGSSFPSRASSGQTGIRGAVRARRATCARPCRSAPDVPAAPAYAPAIAAPVAHTPVAESVPRHDIDALLAAFLKGARVTDMAAPVRLTPALMELMGSIAYHATAGAMELIAARHNHQAGDSCRSHDDRRRRQQSSQVPADARSRDHADARTKDAGIHEGGRSDARCVRRPSRARGRRDRRNACGAGGRVAAVRPRRSCKQRLGESGLLDTLVPAARRARLWDLFEARFEELYREANDDFQSLFGEAFTKAYEEQIELDRARRRQT